jgi:hypothetical protein
VRHSRSGGSAVSRAAFISTGFRFAAAAFVVAMIIVVLLPARPIAQMSGDMGPDMGMGPAPRRSPGPSTSALPAPVPKIKIPEPIQGSMLVSPPIGTAPLSVGFFVLATDPENMGFLTYSWNFGDGTVSSLPPELYIFHTYRNPGTYVCTLTMTTVDGRSAAVFQGVTVRPPTD